MFKEDWGILYYIVFKELSFIRFFYVMVVLVFVVIVYDIGLIF